MILIIGGAFQGKEKFARERFGGGKILKDAHRYIREEIERGKKREEIYSEISEGGYDIIISNEIGCGIVPIDKNERYIREETGRILCDTARICNEVWRVQCGIGMKIKG